MLLAEGSARFEDEWKVFFFYSMKNSYLTRENIKTIKPSKRYIVFFCFDLTRSLRFIFKQKPLTNSYISQRNFLFCTILCITKIYILKLYSKIFLRHVWKYVDLSPEMVLKFPKMFPSSPVTWTQNLELYFNSKFDSTSTSQKVFLNY